MNFRLKENYNIKMAYKVVDLFSGTGAFSYCFENSPSNKFECVFANDICKNSKKIYDVNHSNIKLTLEDLNKINVKDIPTHDILCAGFSCQPFSIAGKKEGFKDSRTQAFFKTIEIIKFHNTPIVIFENVKNLLSHDKGRSMGKIKKLLEDLNYNYKFKLLNTCKITNVPQNRERVFMVCFKDKNLFDKFDLDFELVKSDNIVDFLEEKVDNKYYYTDRYKMYDIAKSEILKTIDKNVVYQFRRHYIRENKSGVCPTLTANMGGGGHNVPLILTKEKKIRKLTPRECFNLQGFPKTFILPENMSNSALYKLSGNAVSIPVVKLIVNKIAILLGKKD